MHLTWINYLRNLMMVLYYRANTVVPDAFGKYNDHKAKGYTLDLKEGQ